MVGLAEARDRVSTFNRLAAQRPYGTGHVQVCDVTLRDGEQAVDVAYNDQEKVDILWALSDAGVKRAQIGFTGRDESVATAAKSAGVPIDLELMTVLTNQNWRSELSLARDIGVDSVNLLIRSSDDMIRLLGLDRSSVAALAVEATKFARELGFQHVVFGPSFVTQADPEFLLSLYKSAGSV